MNQENYEMTVLRQLGARQDQLKQTEKEQARLSTLHEKLEAERNALIDKLLELRAKKVS